jgi:hypothetical protein
VSSGKFWGGVSKPIILWAIYGDIAGISWDYIMIDIGYNAISIQPTI